MANLKKPYLITNTRQALSDAFDAYQRNPEPLKKFDKDIEHWLLDAAFNLDHMVDIDPYAERHPNKDKYTIRTFSAMESRDQAIEISKRILPKDVLDYLNDKKTNYTDQVQGDLTNWSFEDIPTPDTIIIIENDADKALYTIQELERIANLVMEDYDGADNGIWEQLNLGGDDDVDYAGSYLSEACILFRLYCYTEFNDERFLKL